MFFNNKKVNSVAEQEILICIENTFMVTLIHEGFDSRVL